MLTTLQWWWDLTLLPARTVVTAIQRRRSIAYIEHDYTNRRWGRDYTITEVYRQGKRLRITGWGRGLKSGHYLILPNQGRTTRYQIMSVSYYNDPTDMWYADAEFAPRRLRA